MADGEFHMENPQKSVNSYTTAEYAADPVTRYAG